MAVKILDLQYSSRVSAPNMVQRLVGGSALVSLRAVPGKLEQQPWYFVV